uniref:Uncharacterized protein n=1 Tax=Ciona intestinalis TaxID=7719 RepID=H2XKV8_CIOIN
MEGATSLRGLLYSHLRNNDVITSYMCTIGRRLYAIRSRCKQLFRCCSSRPTARMGPDTTGRSSRTARLC